MNLLPNLHAILLAFVIGISTGALSTGVLTAKYKDSQWTAVLAARQAAAATELQKATKHALDMERANVQLAETLETTHAENSAKQDKLLADNRRLVRELGGLRDPGRRADCIAVPTTPGAARSPEDQAPGAGLSDEATEFLLEFARDADRAAEYAATCHRWAQGLTQ